MYLELTWIPFWIPIWIEFAVKLGLSSKLLGGYCWPLMRHQA